MSNLSFLSKILEKVVLRQLSNHLLTNNLFFSHQSAHRAGHSTETAFLKIVNDLSALDEDKVSPLSLFDQSAAFDTIDHSILLSRLSYSFGISETVLAWFTLYLSDRRKNRFCKRFQMAPGSTPLRRSPGNCPRANPLCSLHSTPFYDNQTPLFYITTAFLVITSSTFLPTSPNFRKLSRLQNRAYLMFRHGCTTIDFNWIPMRQGWFSSLLNTTRKACSSLSLSMWMEPRFIFLQPSATCCVTLDHNLPCQLHVSCTCQFCYLELRRINSIRHHLSQDALKTLISAFVLSRIDYCNSLLACCPKQLIHKLQKVQNNSTRLICQTPKSDHTSPVLHTLQWLPVEQRIEYKLLLLAFKSVSNDDSSYLSDPLKFYIPSRQLCSSSDSRLLRIPSFRLKSFGQRKLPCQASFYGTLPRSHFVIPTLHLPSNLL